MDDFLGQQHGPIKRAQFLKDNCEVMENIGYTRDFTTEELDTMKDNLADTSIELNDLNIEKKELVKSYRDQMKPLDKKLKVLLENIRTKTEYVHEDCFKFVDQEEKLVGYYNGDGKLVSTRRIKPEERQTNMYALSKTGTNE